MRAAFAERGLTPLCQLACHWDAERQARTHAQIALAASRREGPLGYRNHHLRSDEVARLVRDPAILALAHEILGDHIVLWRTQVFGAGGARIGFHRDNYDKLLSPSARGLSIQLALNDHATPSDCFVCLPGTHRMDEEELLRTYPLRPKSIGTTYGVKLYFDGSGIIPERIVARAGEFFAFHDNIVHASGLHIPVPGDRALDAPTEPSRLSITIRLVSADIRVLEAAMSETPGDTCLSFSR
jgi:ectoine hydroxylase-related dioxygenase (phytanoyl-CoA dioxygenase family)